MAKYFDLGLKAAFACLCLALMGVLLIVIAPPLLGLGSYSTEGPLGTLVNSVLPILVMLLLLLSGLIFVALWLLAIIDILKSKNEGKWKLLWVLAVLIFGPLGFMAYYFYGQKELKE